MEKKSILQKVIKIFFPKNEYQEVCGECSTDEDNDEKYRVTTLPSQQCDNNRTEVLISEVNRQSEYAITMIASRDRPQFYRNERWRTFFTFLFLVFAFSIACISLSLTHDRLPDRKIYKPLPDIFLDNFASVDSLLSATEIQIIVSVNVSILLVLLHKNRFVIAKRCFFLLSILYLYRSITMFVTVLPISSETYYCSPKSNSTSPLDIVKRAGSLFLGMGLSINNRQTFCGDSIFSGHTTILVFTSLIINEYAPKKLRILSFLSIVNALVGSIFLLCSHAHYTIDVIIAYYITTRLWWTYHSLCHATNSPGKHEWWYPIFNYLEKNSNRVREL